MWFFGVWGGESYGWVYEGVGAFTLVVFVVGDAEEIGVGIGVADGAIG